MRSRLRSIALVLSLFALATVGLISGGGTVSATSACSPTLYVTNFLSNDVSAIDTSTDTVVGSPIPVGVEPGSIAITPDGTRAYVTDYGSGTVSVITLATNVTTVINTVPNPIAVALTPDGTRAYVTNFVTSSVTVIDTTTDTIATTISTAPETGPLAIAITPDGFTALVANADSNTVSVIDTTTDAVTTTIPVGNYPLSIAVGVTPSGVVAYVVNSLGQTISVIDLDTTSATYLQVVATITGVNSPSTVTLAPDGVTAYIASYNSGYVTTIDTVSNAIHQVFAVGVNLQGMVIDPQGTKAYVADFAANAVVTVDLTTNSRTGSIAIGRAPLALALTPCQAPPEPTTTTTTTVDPEVRPTFTG